ncbi:hypothetical protein D3C87_863000 [compost metagenome]
MGFDQGRIGLALRFDSQALGLHAGLLEGLLGGERLLLDLGLGLDGLLDGLGQGDVRDGHGLDLHEVVADAVDVDDLVLEAALKHLLHQGGDPGAAGLVDLDHAVLAEGVAGSLLDDRLPAGGDQTAMAVEGFLVTLVELHDVVVGRREIGLVLDPHVDRDFLAFLGVDPEVVEVDVIDHGREFEDPRADSHEVEAGAQGLSGDVAGVDVGFDANRPRFDSRAAGQRKGQKGNERGKTFHVGFLLGDGNSPAWRKVRRRRSYRAARTGMARTR